MSNSTGNLDIPRLGSYTPKSSPRLVSFVNNNDDVFESERNAADIIDKDELADDSVASNSHVFAYSVSNIFVTSSSNISATPEIRDSSGNLERENFGSVGLRTDGFLTKERLARHNSEPPDMYSSRNVQKDGNKMDNNLTRQHSDSLFAVSRKPNIEIVYTPENARDEDDKTKVTRKTSSSQSSDSMRESRNDLDPTTTIGMSPIVKNKFWNVHAAHTSTPSDLLRRNMANGDYVLTPITSSDSSMSPITQSTSKMSKAMQVRMFLIISLTRRT